MTPGDARLGDAVCDALDADYFVRRERERNKKGFHSTSSSNGHFFLCLFLVSRRRFLYWGLGPFHCTSTTHNSHASDIAASTLFLLESLYS